MKSITWRGRFLPFAGLTVVGLGVVAFWVGVVAIKSPCVATYFTGSGHILVRAEIGGMDGWYLLDTGSQATTVTPQVASRLKPTGTTREMSSPEGTNGPVQVPKVLSGDIRFGSDRRVRIPGQINVSDLGPLARLLGHELDGILGWDFLANYVLGIDVQGKRVFASRTATANEMMSRMGATGPTQRLALTIMGDGPFVEASSEGHEFKLMIDTGRTMTTLFRASWDRVSNVPPNESEPVVGWTISGESSGYAARLAELRLGPLRLVDHTIKVRDQQSWVVTDGLSKAVFDGLLGMDVLSQNVVVIDGPGHGLYVAEARASP